MNVRLATLDDAAAIAAIHVRTWQHAYRGHMPDAFLDALTPESRRPFWIRMLTGMTAPWATFVADDIAGVVGFCSVGPSRVSTSLEDGTRSESTMGDVYSIYVLPEHQGKGAGRMLLNRACEHLRDDSLSEAILWVLAGHVPAMTFYERMGWHADGSSKQEEIAGMTIREHRYWRSLP